MDERAFIKKVQEAIDEYEGKSEPPTDNMLGGMIILIGNGNKYEMNDGGKLTCVRLIE